MQYVFKDERHLNKYIKKYQELADNYSKFINWKASKFNFLMSQNLPPIAVLFWEKYLLIFLKLDEDIFGILANRTLKYETHIAF